MYKNNTIFSESRYCLYCIFGRITVSCNCHRTHVSVKSIVRWAQQPQLCFHWLNVQAIGGFGARRHIGASDLIGASNCPFHPIPGQPCPVHPVPSQPLPHSALSHSALSVLPTNQVPDGP